MSLNTGVRCGARTPYHPRCSQTHYRLSYPQQINGRKTEIQIIRLHLTQPKQFFISNLYIPLRQTTDPDHSTEDEDINRAFSFLEPDGPHINIGDTNAYSST